MTNYRDGYKYKTSKDSLIALNKAFKDAEKMRIVTEEKNLKDAEMKMFYFCSSLGAKSFSEVSDMIRLGAVYWEPEIGEWDNEKRTIDNRLVFKSINRENYKNLLQ